MKKQLSILTMTALSLFASDPITIDSLFKNQIGFRSVTSLSLLSSGNPNIYTSYPNLLIQGDPVVWDETKQLGLSQIFIYSLTSRLDILASFNGSYRRNDYVSYLTLEPKSENRTDFDSFWLGLNYKGNKIGELVPFMTFQAAVIQREMAMRKSKNFNFKSYSLKGTLRGYSDPVIYSIFAGVGYNAKRNFSFAKIRYGNSFFFGGDLNIALSPKITLDLGIEQRFQTEQKVNSKKTTNIRSIPTYNVGSTYAVDDDTSISLSATFGGSSAAPDSIFGISIWQKF